MIYLLIMVIFYGYVKLLEGILHNMVIVVYTWDTMGILRDMNQLMNSCRSHFVGN